MRRLAALAAAALAFAAVPADAATVLANNPGLTSLGNFAAGTYNFSSTGVISLTGNPGEFDVDADGTPVTPVTASGYGYCNPNGCGVDIPGGGASGPGGPTRNFGAVLGTLTASPSSPADYFLIGTGSSFTLASAGTIYAVVNDTYYGNNTGSFDVNVTAVPEPAQWALLIGGFAVAGAAVRRRRATMPAAIA